MAEPINLDDLIKEEPIESTETIETKINNLKIDDKSEIKSEIKKKQKSKKKTVSSSEEEEEEVEIKKKQKSKKKNVSSSEEEKTTKKNKKKIVKVIDDDEDIKKPSTTLCSIVEEIESKVNSGVLNKPKDYKIEFKNPVHNEKYGWNVNCKTSHAISFKILDASPILGVYGLSMCHTLSVDNNELCSLVYAIAKAVEGIKEIKKYMKIDLSVSGSADIMPGNTFKHYTKVKSNFRIKAIKPSNEDDCGYIPESNYNGYLTNDKVIKIKFDYYTKGLINLNFNKIKIDKLGTKLTIILDIDFVYLFKPKEENYVIMGKTVLCKEYNPEVELKKRKEQNINDAKSKSIKNRKDESEEDSQEEVSYKKSKNSVKDEKNKK